MNIWHLLNIEPTTDKKVIKRAYSKLLKVTNPEDNPQGYQRLREAYDAALKYADNCNNEAIVEKPIKVDTEEEKVNFNHIVQLNKTEDIESLEINTMPPIEFEKMLSSLYENFDDRISLDRWKEILKIEELWDLRTGEYFKHILFKFICENNLMPTYIYKHIDEVLGFSEEAAELNNKFTVDFMEIYFKRLKEPSLKYINLNLLSEDKLREYIEIRNKVYSYVDNRTFFYYKDLEMELIEIFDKDPELYRLIGEAYLNAKGYMQANTYFIKSLRYDKENIETLHMYSRSLTEFKQYKQAVEIFDKILEVDKDNLDSILNGAICYFKVKNYGKAREYFRNLKSKRYKVEICEKYLEAINEIEGGNKKVKITDANEDMTYKNTTPKMKFTNILKSIIGSVAGLVLLIWVLSFPYYVQDKNIKSDKQQYLTSFSDVVLVDDGKRRDYIAVENYLATDIYYRSSLSTGRWEYFFYTPGTLELKELQSMGCTRLYCASFDGNLIIFNDPLLEKKIIDDKVIFKTDVKFIDIENKNEVINSVMDTYRKVYGEPEKTALEKDDKLIMF